MYKYYVKMFDRTGDIIIILIVINTAQTSNRIYKTDFNIIQKNGVLNNQENYKCLFKDPIFNINCFVLLSYTS